MLATGGIEDNLAPFWTWLWSPSLRSQFPVHGIYTRGLALLEKKKKNWSLKMKKQAKLTFAYCITDVQYQREVGNIVKEWDYIMYM